ncbi:MAG: hypothetical protein HQL13_01160 [Candidatus Omnitrophica bacterium]|nr:hypothetical protein [Candidatus Omnitrophota bacterium]
MDRLIATAFVGRGNQGFYDLMGLVKGKCINRTSIGSVAAAFVRGINSHVYEERRFSMLGLKALIEEQYVSVAYVRQKVLVTGVLQQAIVDISNAKKSSMSLELLGMAVDAHIISVDNGMIVSPMGKKINKTGDRAMRVAIRNNTGGIDLTAPQMPLGIQHFGQGIKLQFNQAQVAALDKSQGFEPIVTGWHLGNLREFLEKP